MQLLDTILYWQRVKNNCRLGTGSVFNYCSYLGAPVEDVNICPVANYKLFLVKSGGATKCSWHFMDVSTSSTYIYNYKLQMIFYVGCFNWLNIYNYKMQMRIWNEQIPNDFQTLRNKWNYKKLGTSAFFCTKRPLAGYLYCSPSPSLSVGVIQSRILKINHHQSPSFTIRNHQ